MVLLDYSVIVLFLAIVLTVGLKLSKKAGKSAQSFILSDRNLPWWLAGISNSALDFNADSAIHQTAKIRQTGMTGMWLYWSKIIGDIGGGIIFARLWRRTKLTTPVEFYSIRYTGKGAHMARLVNASYTAFIKSMVPMIMGLLAIKKLVPILFGLPETVQIMGLTTSTDLLIILSILVLTMIYSTAAGLIGIVVTDFFEFFMALICSYILTIFVLREAGWSTGLMEKLGELQTQIDYLNFKPQWGLVLVAWWFIQPLSMMQPQGGEALRYLATKNEKQAMYAGVCRIIVHYIIRGWPWYVAGLATLVILPATVSHELAYVSLINDFMPAGLKGLMVAGFLAALMSSIDTGMHTSSAVFMNDIYKPYIKRDATDKHYVFVARIGIVVYSIVGAYIALKADSVLGMVLMFFKLATAQGIIVMLRWFWWRINAWADISAQVAALPLVLIFNGENSPSVWVAQQLGWSGIDAQYALDVCFIFIIGTAIWVAVMLLTKPEDEKVLESFYRKVRPYGFWGPIARKCQDVVIEDSASRDLFTLCLGIIFFYCFLFAFGLLFLAQFQFGIILAVIAIVSGTVFFRTLIKKY